MSDLHWLLIILAVEGLYSMWSGRKSWAAHDARIQRINEFEADRKVLQENYLVAKRESEYWLQENVKLYARLRKFEEQQSTTSPTEKDVGQK